MVKWVAIWLALIALCLPLRAAERDLGRVGTTGEGLSPRIRVLAMGVSDFQYLGPKRDLQYAEKDAQLFVDTLVDGARGAIAEPDIRRLVGKDATLSAVRAALGEVLGNARSGDVVVLYFSTHGALERSHDGYLLTRDSDPSHLATTALPIRELELAIQTTDARHVLLFTDACHSAVAGASLSPIPGQKGSTDETVGPLIASLQRESSFYNLASSLVYESSLEDRSFCGGHGAFTCALTRALKGEADRDHNGQVNLVELTLYVPTAVHDLTGAEQLPEAKGAYDKFMILSLPHRPDEDLPRWSNSDGYELIALPPNTFTMGTSSRDPADLEATPPHTVHVSAFAIGTTEVTRGMWDRVMGTHSPGAVSSVLPVNEVSWCDAVRFCNRLTALENMNGAQFEPAYTIPEDCETSSSVAWNHKANGFRLPTEAEWEYAARANTTTRYSTGDADDSVDAAAWTGTNSQNQPHEVRLKSPNAFGLYDVHGNVWEWVWDRYGPYTSDYLRDPIGNLLGQNRTARGGGYWGETSEVQSSSRMEVEASVQHPLIGFRLAISELPP